jgi:hypothetical protein
MKHSLLVTGSVLALSAVAPAAQAHIDLVDALQSRGGDQKTHPCGGVKRGAGPVYTFEPGAVVEISIDENVPHDSYFRISFDADGEDGFKDPASINPINPNRVSAGQKCMGTADDHCGKSDFCNSPTVLWDGLDPHLGGAGTSWKYKVQLPNVECTNCTIQVMQIMEDIALGFHGPFDGKSDLYYRCIDVVLKKGAGMTPGTVAGPEGANKGMKCGSGGSTSPVATDAGVASGTTTDGGTTDGGATDGGTTDAGLTSGDAGYSSGDAGSSSSPSGSSVTDAGAGGGGTTVPQPAVVGSTADAGALPIGTGVTGSSSDAGIASAASDSSTDDGGCAVRGQRANEGALLSMLFVLGAAFLRRRRREV